MRFFTNDFGNPNAYYEPNQYGGPVADPAVAEPPLRIDAEAFRHRQDPEDIDFVQPRKLYAEVLSDDERKRLHQNMAGAMSPCSDGVKERWYAVLERVHPDYAKGVREAVESAPALPVTDDTPVEAAE